MKISVGLVRMLVFRKSAVGFRRGRHRRSAWNFFFWKRPPGSGISVLTFRKVWERYPTARTLMQSGTGEDGPIKSKIVKLMVFTWIWQRGVPGCYLFLSVKPPCVWVYTWNNLLPMFFCYGHGLHPLVFKDGISYLLYKYLARIKSVFILFLIRLIQLKSIPGVPDVVGKKRSGPVVVAPTETCPNMTRPVTNCGFISKTWIIPRKNHRILAPAY